MDDKLKVFWNLDVLVKMCRSKSDGPSLRVEEVEIQEKIKSYNQEIEEIKAISEEDNYDTSAEMADRNIEIITKKQLQTLKNELKEKNKYLNKLKEEETNLYERTSLLRDNKNSQEKYIVSMQERIGSAIDSDIIDRYNSLIAETSEKIASINDELKEESSSYNEVQERIIELTEELEELEEKIDKKKKLLSETQANLENKDNYIDKSKKEKNNKRIVDLESKIEKLNNRIEEIKADPKYLESKIKDVINNKEDISNARDFLLQLINQVIKIKYINVPADNTLEEELLRATQARDSFANEIDQKSYNILEADTPEKIRIEFLTERIENWTKELENQKQKISQIDKDQQFSYENKNIILSDMIRAMKKDLKEFQRAYDEAPDINIGAKASLKAALDAQKEDIIEAEKIATAFKNDEAEDIAIATRTIKYECEQLNNNIKSAESEIKTIKNRLTSKKSGLIDISTRNKDKDILKELAQTVIDIKHRRQFPETPIEIVSRLEEELSINLLDGIDMDLIKETSSIESKDYEEFIREDEYEIVEDIPRDNLGLEIEDELSDSIEQEAVETLTPKRGIKVVNEAEIARPEEVNDDEEDNQASQRLEAAIKEISDNEELNSFAENDIIENESDEQVKPEETLKLNQEDNIENEIPSETSEEEALDIEEIINSNDITNEKLEDSNQSSLSINSIFNQENDTEEEKDDNIITSQDLEDELNAYLNNLNIKQDE